jgi:hypothetical protein
MDTNKPHYKRSQVEAFNVREEIELRFQVKIFSRNLLASAHLVSTHPSASDAARRKRGKSRDLVLVTTSKARRPRRSPEAELVLEQ